MEIVHPKMSHDFPMPVVVVVDVGVEEEVVVVIVVVMVPEMANLRHGVVDRKVVTPMGIEINRIEMVNLHNPPDVWVGVMFRQLVQINHHVCH